jgi:hypothetical protein
MRERPHILSTEFFNQMNIRQLRMWFFHRITLLKENSNRLHFEGNELHFEGDLMIYETKKYSEYITNYQLTIPNQMGWIERMIRNFIGI